MVYKMGVLSTNQERHADVCRRLNEIYVAKNQDYGDSFGDMFRKLGIITALTRMGDKLNRLISLSTKPASEQKVLDESIKDTVLDLANYAIMTVMEIEALEVKDDNCS